jgi:prepilin-type N-terminal cleavage/methylation domain-containing protein
MSLKKNVKGFTLIELMIVVAIIGILAAVAVPKFADLVTKSKEASVKGALGSVRSALSIYYGDTEGVYPNDLFTALTSANKYLPAVASQSSLGRYEIPAHAQNPGHKTGFYANASGIGAVMNDTSGTAVVPVEGGEALAYGSQAGPANGEVYVNCVHNDTQEPALELVLIDSLM